MKKKLFFISTILLVFTAVAVLNTACEEEPKEACEQDVFCEGEPEVTLCCTDGSDCYWTYNGKNYPDTSEGIDELYDDLGCTTTTKSGEKGDEYDYIMEKLLAMRERVIEASKR